MKTNVKKAQPKRERKIYTRFQKVCVQVAVGEKNQGDDDDYDDLTMVNRWNCCWAELSSRFQWGDPTGWWAGECGLPIMSMGLVLLSNGLP